MTEFLALRRDTARFRERQRRRKTDEPHIDTGAMAESLQKLIMVWGIMAAIWLKAAQLIAQATA